MSDFPIPEIVAELRHVRVRELEGDAGVQIGLAADEQGRFILCLELCGPDQRAAAQRQPALQGQNRHAPHWHNAALAALALNMGGVAGSDIHRDAGIDAAVGAFDEIEEPGPAGGRCLCGFFRQRIRQGIRQRIRQCCRGPFRPFLAR